MKTFTEQDRIKQFEEVMKPCNLPKYIVGDLQNMGFFIAPASIHHHGAYSGALFDHSLAVMNSLLKCFLVNREKFREDWKGWFIRWNGQLNDWEIFQDIRVRKDG